MKTKSPPTTSLTVLPTPPGEPGLTRWAIVIIRANGRDLDTLAEMYHSFEEAKAFAERCCGWYALVKVCVVPVAFKMEQAHPVETGKEPAPFCERCG